ncbi:archaeosortase/exosortase family protein [Pedobacter sp. SYSU D00535]|uniref:archaeosortase/exosortase family protein n=1 Tax=Pedobacter sp. SYSU D00535 TaxID=2810308 RepID=UPI001A95DFB4|nr:archaeosortase/exosortase family protein [Pedobacter sp. SYSU D00535]
MYRKFGRRFKEQVWRQPLYRFLLVFLGLFFVLDYWHWAFEGIVTPRNYYSPFIDDHFNYLRGFTHILLGATKMVISLIGYPSFVYGDWLRIPGQGGVIVAYPCLGFGVMNFFTAFVVAYPKPLKEKILFFFFGIAFIQLLNMGRFIYLCLSQEDSFLGFTNHHDAFNFVIYLCLFFLIVIWVNLGGKKRAMLAAQH